MLKEERKKLSQLNITDGTGMLLLKEPLKTLANQPPRPVITLASMNVLFMVNFSNQCF